MSRCIAVWRMEVEIDGEHRQLKGFNGDPDVERMWMRQDRWPIDVPVSGELVEGGAAQLEMMGELDLIEDFILARIVSGDSFPFRIVMSDGDFEAETRISGVVVPPEREDGGGDLWATFRMKEIRRVAR